MKLVLKKKCSPNCLYFLVATSSDISFELLLLKDIMNMINIPAVYAYMYVVCLSTSDEN